MIAIISVLAAMLLPALQRARNSANQTACMSNMKQLGVFVTLYANDNEDWYPANKTDSGSPGWWRLELAPYAGIPVNDPGRTPIEWTWRSRMAGRSSVFGCPEFPEIPVSLISEVSVYPGLYSGIGWLDKVSGYPVIPFKDQSGSTTALKGNGTTGTYNHREGRVRASMFRRASGESALLADVIDTNQHASSIKESYSKVIHPEVAVDDASFILRREQRVSRRHNNGLNFLWADLHVSWMSQSAAAAGNAEKAAWYYTIHP